MEPSRRLAAIMFTDIVGYTALMGDNSKKALELVHISKEIQKPLVEKNHGKWLKEMGDGALIQFSTALDAVNCAIEIQEQARAKFDGKLRIGIHLGDITIEDGDVYGDGVNVASRLEAITDPGGIYISDAILKAIQGQSDIQTKYLGEIPLKNVAYELRTYAVQGIGLPIPAYVDWKPPKVSESKKKFPLRAGIVTALVIVILAFYLYQKLFTESNRDNTEMITETEGVIVDKSLAILPFEDLSPNQDQEYFSDGMMEEILNHLAKIKDFRLTSRTTMMTYKGANKTIHEIADEVGVRYLLEGSVQKSISTFRINAQLIDAHSDEYIWSQTYDRNLADALHIQSEVAQQIAKELEVSIKPSVLDRIEAVPTQNMEAYDLYLQALQFPLESEERKSLLEEVISLDPEFASAYAMLAGYWLIRGAYAGDLSRNEVLEFAEPLLNRALELDHENVTAHDYLSLMFLWFKWDFNASIRERLIAQRLAPSNVEMKESDVLLASGRYEEALDVADERLRFEPNRRSYSNTKGLVLSFLNKPEEAIFYLEAANIDNPSGWGLFGDGGRAYLYIGHYDQVITLLERSLEEGYGAPRMLGTLAIAYYHRGRTNAQNELIQQLKEMGIQSSVGSPAFYLAMIYAQMGEIDTAFEWLDKAYRDHEVEMYWLKVEPPFKPLYDDPRWQEMLDKVGFPE